MGASVYKLMQSNQVQVFFVKKGPQEMKATKSREGKQTVEKWVKNKVNFVGNELGNAIA